MQDVDSLFHHNNLLGILAMEMEQFLKEIILYIEKESLDEI